MELDIDKKFARAMVKMRELRPFYSAIYESIPHIATNSIDTMAVNGRALLYNEEFVEKLTFEKFMFILLHEVGHIALLHVPRVNTRDKELWNIACDLYNNKMLAEEFDISPGIKDNSSLVEFPYDGLWCSSIDLDVDSVESLYDKLCIQGYKNGYFDKDSGKFKFTISGSGRKLGSHSEINLTLQKSSVSRLSTNTKDSKNKDNRVINNAFDLIPDESISPEELEAENRQVITDALVKNEMSGGIIRADSCILDGYVKKLLESKLDWKKLLKKYCRTIISKDTSYRMPDKRMFYQEAIYPGNSSEGENVLEKVKVCFDRSGSISERDMQYFYGQLKSLLKAFKLDAEVIDWDTEILNKHKLSENTKVTQSNIIRGGGTCPNCIFEYFDSKNCKSKPVVTVIFTDGFITMQKKKRWKHKYKDTIWVMTRNYNKDFKPYFGKIAIAEFPDTKGKSK